MRGINLGQIAPGSEWALTKFFSAIKDFSISEYFKLVAVCGMEYDKEHFTEGLLRNIDRWTTYLSNGLSKSYQQMIHNTNALLIDLAQDKMKYQRVNGGFALPQEIHDMIDAIVIHTDNHRHLDYIKEGLNNGKHVLCEKPLVTTIDINARPIRYTLDSLEELINKSPQDIVVMDAEHYSYKMPAQIFYIQFHELIGNAKITSVEGEIKEIDDPNFDRTIRILSRENGTGLLGDTMVHLLSFITNIDGQATPTNRIYDSYTNYLVDTYDSVDFTLKGNNFAENATAKFTVAKFINKFSTPEDKESKYITFNLSDGNSVKLDFVQGNVKQYFADGRENDFTGKGFFHPNEYVNILRQFYAAINNHIPPLTDWRKSVRTLDTIYKIGTLPKDVNEKRKVYN